eukprot:scaffold199258_cov37-Tisochrysis_lutea.AAC.1
MPTSVVYAHPPTSGNPLGVWVCTLVVCAASDVRKSSIIKCGSLATAHLPCYRTPPLLPHTSLATAHLPCTTRDHLDTWGRTFLGMNHRQQHGSHITRLHGLSDCFRPIGVCLPPAK